MLVYLQQLLVTARPEKTQLLANYPNPFNPETWIPYELATDTNVRLTIYNTQGVVIRTLQFGHQSAGYYTGRDRAAYWDGRNALGEQVASGLYFYQLETDEMSLMRKMVILKYRLSESGFSVGNQRLTGLKNPTEISLKQAKARCESRAFSVLSEAGFTGFIGFSRIRSRG